MNAFVDDYLFLPNDSILSPLSLVDGTENVSSAIPTALDKRAQPDMEMTTGHSRMQQISGGDQFNSDGAYQTSTGSCDGSPSSQSE